MKKDKKSAKKKSVAVKTSSETVEEKVFDVARPGETVPSSSSRPLIISHKPGISSDPMVSAAGSPSNHDVKNEDDEKGDTDVDKDIDKVAANADEQVMKAPKKNRIEPLNPTITLEGKEEPSDDVEVLKDEESKAAASDESSQDAPAEEKYDEADDIRGEIEDVSASVTTTKQAKEEEAKKEQQEREKRAEIEKLIENKHFFVPINSAQKRRSRRAVIMLGLLLIVVVGVLAAVDVEVIDIGIEPLTDFL